MGANAVTLCRRQVLLMGLALLGPVRSAWTAAAKALYIQPLGDALPDEDEALVVLSLREFHGLEVRQLPRVPMPQSARMQAAACRAIRTFSGRVQADKA